MSIIISIGANQAARVMIGTVSFEMIGELVFVVSQAKLDIIIVENHLVILKGWIYNIIVPSKKDDGIDGRIIVKRED